MVFILVFFIDFILIVYFLRNFLSFDKIKLIRLAELILKLKLDLQAIGQVLLENVIAVKLFAAFLAFIRSMKIFRVSFLKKR